MRSGESAYTKRGGLLASKRGRFSPPLASVCRDARQVMKRVDLPTFERWGNRVPALVFPLDSTKILYSFSYPRPRKWGTPLEPPLEPFLYSTTDQKFPKRRGRYYITEISLGNGLTSPRREDVAGLSYFQSLSEKSKYCAPLETIERIILIHATHDSFVEGCVKKRCCEKHYCQWDFIHRLWPSQIPNLKEVYLIDEFMSLRDDSRLPPEQRERIEGLCATFFEVNEDDRDIWEPFFSADLLVQGAKVREHFERQTEPGYTIPTFKFLACVPHPELMVPVLAAGDGPAREGKKAEEGEGWA